MNRYLFEALLGIAVFTVTFGATGCSSNLPSAPASSSSTGTASQSAPQASGAPMQPGQMGGPQGMASPQGMTSPSGMANAPGTPGAHGGSGPSMAMAPSMGPGGPGTPGAPGSPGSPGMMGSMASPPPGTAGGSSNSDQMAQYSAMMAKNGSMAGKGSSGSAPDPSTMSRTGAPGMANNPGDSSAQSGMMNRGQGSQGGSGTPGGPGTRGGPGSQSNNFAPGSVDDTLARFCTALAEGDTAAASEFISAKAKALAGKLRDGELSDEQIEEITDAIVPISELQPTANSTLTKRGLRNGKNQSISFTLKKEDDSYKITEFTVSKPKKPIQ